MTDYLIGTAAVGLVIVDGPGSAAFTDAERTSTILEVSHGFDILYQLSSKSPISPHVLFVTEVRTVTLTLDPSAVPAPTVPGSSSIMQSEISSLEPIWRDPALTQLGYATGQAGIDAYRQALLNKSWSVAVAPKWAFVVFFTKYNTCWLAYASKGRITMQYSYLATADPWGSAPYGMANIERVFAHETGHIFGASDEYASSNCHTTDTGGYLNIANANCEVNNPSSVDCLMKSPKFNTVCPSTMGQLGWVDANGDGKLDPLP